MLTITPEQLTKIAPSIKGERAVEIAALLTKICPQYGIDSPNIFHEFIANVLHECGEFTRFKENLNYSAEGLHKTWPNRFPSVEYAEEFERNPQKIADKVYSGRMGNIHPGDGWKFSGCGPVQLTGREMITLFTVYYNRKNNTTYSAESMAELLRVDIEIGIHSACWLFAVAKNLLSLAKTDNMKEIVKRINGGFTGMNERLVYYEKAKQFIQ